MKISIIIPSYNKAYYINRCLDSICTYNGELELEILVIDDCSQDNTVALVKKLSKHDARIKLIEHTVNKGTYMARETGILQAEGDYICCIDPDDWIDSTVIDDIIPYLGKIDIIAFNAFTVYENDKMVFWGNAQDLFLMGPDIIEYYSNIWLVNWGVCSKFIKTDIAKKALKDIDCDRCLVVTEDLLLFFTCCLNAQTYQLINKGLYYYWNADQESATRKQVTIQNLLSDLDQTEYAIKRLTTLFEKNTIDTFKLVNTKKALFHCFRSKKLQISQLSFYDRKIIIERLVQIFGSFEIYSAFTEYLLSSKENKLLNFYRKFNNFSIKLLPYGSKRRNIVIFMIKIGYKFLRLNYRLLKKLLKRGRS